jgi:hypothetical protein
MNKLKLITPEQKHAFCMVSIAPLRKEASDASEIISQLLFGEPVEILSFGKPWVKVQSFLDGYEGFVDIKHLLPLTAKELKKWLDSKIYSTSKHTEIQTEWGLQIVSKASLIGEEKHIQIGAYSFEILKQEAFNQKTIWEEAMDYINTPYLWGGKSITGIDCSGFTQSVFRLFDINLPRDAYQQEAFGETIEFSDKKEGDLAFFVNANGKIIHVGIVGNENQIIHASGRVKIDELTFEGIFSCDFEETTHKLLSIKRLIL